MRTNLTQLAVASILTCCGVHASAEYHFVQPKSQGMPKENPISVSLNPTGLPVATKSLAYAGFSFLPSLSITGDPSLNTALASFEIASGTLPTGLQLSQSGTLSGAPETVTSGASFTVKATYKSKSGQQVYTLVVNSVLLEVTTLAVGPRHTCAVTVAGGVKCWGAGTYGGLGIAAVGSSFVPSALTRSTPQDVTGLATGVSAVSVGEYSSCALLATGGVKCWGHGYYGELGTGIAGSSGYPVQVSGLLSGVTQLTMGDAHACVIQAGIVKCWGRNARGQMSDGTSSNWLTPDAITGLPGALVQISAGGRHTCGLTATGTASCWGDNETRQLGDWRNSPSSLPGPYTSISGGFHHTCAVKASGTVDCWGFNNSGATGSNTLGQTYFVPVAVTGLSDALTVSAGADKTCAATTSGSVKCWGYNADGRLGIGNTTQQLYPVTLPGVTGASAVSSGGSVGCAVTTSGLKCWGTSATGQLGNGTTTPSLSAINVSL